MALKGRATQGIVSMHETLAAVVPLEYRVKIYAELRIS